ncbi:leucine-rich repeat domain-containing protein [Skeletonema marinoi]|uniref:Leucine-rich repeat domain-containing protein n=1 Tax=Skeletonema marinoi TaxID=267567 RepID=A0AAD8Y2V6_9STRA|nr:leucine-rich repeat domain-containing protein [Skeletonema marinoi]
MADHADNGGDVFVYTGGRAPPNVTRVRIDKSVDVIEEYAFCNCANLVHVETHDGIRRVGRRAFNWCTSLRGINLKSVVEISTYAFGGCGNLKYVEFGENLETIGIDAFELCLSLERLKLPSIVNIERNAFLNCSAVMDIELSERLETIESNAFAGCECLQRIAIPLKRDLFEYNHIRWNYTQFGNCEHLVTVDIVGGDVCCIVAYGKLEN